MSVCVQANVTPLNCLSSNVCPFFKNLNSRNAALKAERKRLKAEKMDMLGQMKQLFATIEDKEKELRDFIRAYEKVTLIF